MPLTSANDDLESNSYRTATKSLTKSLDKAGDPSALNIGEQDAAGPLKNTQATMFASAHGFKIGNYAKFFNIAINCGGVGVPLSFLIIAVVIASASFHIYLTANPGTNGIREDLIMSGLERRLGPFVSHGAINGSSEQHPKRQVYPGTRERQLSRIKAWIDNPASAERILWLNGPAGVGKSAIAQTITHSYTTEKMPASFFFFHSDSSRNDGNRLFPTLAWKFASSIPAIRHHIVHSLNKDPDLGTKDVETQFQELVVRPFEALRKHKRQLPDMVVVIDGVDECVDADLQERLLDVIGNAVTNTRVPLRFLISCRPETHIEKIMNSFQHHTLSINLAECPDANHDIEKYLKVKFHDIAKGRNIDPDKWPGQAIIQKLASKACGQFLYASTVIKFVGDEDNNAKTHLDIVLGLKKSGTTQPFAELDALYIEILERQSDQEFLKTFLALLVAHNSISGHHPITRRVVGGPIALHPSTCSYPHLRRGYGILMDVPEEELRRKLRKMRSLLKFTPDDVVLHHRSFLEFLQDPSRSGQYNISTESAARQYLVLVIDSLVRSSTLLVNEQYDDSDECGFLLRSAEFFLILCSSSHPPIPEIVKMFGNYPSYFDEVLFREDWRGVVRPLLRLQDRLLNLLNFTIPRSECTIFHIVHRLLLHYSYRQLFLDRPEGNHGGSLLTYFRDLKGMFDLMNTLRRFNPEAIAMKVHSWSEAQQLMDRIDYIVNGKYLISSLFSADATQKATQLALEIHTRVPVLPKSFSSITYPGAPHYIPVLCWPCDLETLCRLWLISNFLDHRYILPAFGTKLATRVSGDNWDPIHSWRQSTDPSSNAIIFVMLNLAMTIRYLHSMEIVLSDSIRLDNIYVDSGSRVRISSMELVWSIGGHPLQEVGQRYETSIYMFGYFFCMMYFDSELACTTSSRPSLYNPESSVRWSVWRLIQRCFSAEDKPTINEVIQEMESWKVGL